MAEKYPVSLPSDEDDFYDTSDYKRSDSEGVFTGELMYTLWGKHHQKIAFLIWRTAEKLSAPPVTTAAIFWDFEKWLMVQRLKSH